MSQPPMPPGPPTEPLPQPQVQTWPLLGTRMPISRAAAPKQPKKRFGWPTVIVTAVVALSLGGIVGGIVGGSGNDTATTAAPIATITDTISNGVHEVGVDVKAGQYKTNVPEGALCYWERSRGGDPISDSTSRYKEGPSHESVTLKQGESFQTEDCGTWKRAD
jgi:hypothetical protein